MDKATKERALRLLAEKKSNARITYTAPEKEQDPPESPEEGNKTPDAPRQVQTPPTSSSVQLVRAKLPDTSDPSMSAGMLACVGAALMLFGRRHAR